MKSPGLGALVRRHPALVHRASASAIGGGLVLFVIASVANAGAAPAQHAAVATVSTAPTASAGPATSAVPWFADLQAAPQPAPIAARAAGQAAPAPTDPAAISALAGNGIPTVALNAYRVAAARVANADPGCGIDWALLAGIGREESDHGQFAGAVLHADGASTPRIIGIPLNGQGTALIRDTDHGVLDGDTVFDHAVGPMQFIPSTWAAYGIDADGDGVANVFDINDAALAAARYLCAAGGDLHTHSGQVAAVLAYNDSSQYLAQVLALADAYRRGVPISGIPVGNVTAPLPAVNVAGGVPPANPGAPTANMAAQTSAAKAAAAKAAAAKAAAAKNAAATKAAAAKAATVSAPGGTPTKGSTATPSAGGSSSPAGGKTPSAPASPSPTPAAHGCLLPDLFVPGKCDIPL